MKTVSKGKSQNSLPAASKLMPPAAVKATMTKPAGKKLSKSVPKTK
jgi:hypothetical protein